LQGQGLASVLIVVGEDQFIVIYEDGIYEGIDDFLSVIEVVDIAVLILADPFHNFFFGELTALQLQLQDACFQRIPLGFQILQTLFGCFGDDAKALYYSSSCYAKSTAIRFARFLCPRSSL